MCPTRKLYLALSKGNVHLQLLHLLTNNNINKLNNILLTNISNDNILNNLTLNGLLNILRRLTSTQSSNHGIKLKINATQMNPLRSPNHTQRNQNGGSIVKTNGLRIVNTQLTHSLPHTPAKSITTRTHLNRRLSHRVLRRIHRLHKTRSITGHLTKISRANVLHSLKRRIMSINNTSRILINRRKTAIYSNSTNNRILKHRNSTTSISRLDRTYSLIIIQNYQHLTAKPNKRHAEHIYTLAGNDQVLPSNTNKN